MPQISDAPMKGYFPALDGLRGLSILLVVLNHFIIPLPPALEFLRLRGHLGVEIFFAVSGFLVTRSLHICWVRNKGQVSATLKEFYIRRFARILVPYLIVLSLIFGLSLFVSSLATKLNDISNILFSFFTYTYNYAKFFNPNSAPSSLNITWSLAFEEQFYILLGLTFLLARKKLSLALLALALSSLLLRFYSVLTLEDLSFNKIQFWTHMRLDSILWGCLLYLNWDTVRNFFIKFPWLYFIIPIGFITALIFGSSSYSLLTVSIAFTLTALFFTLIILYVQTKPQSLITKILSVAPIVFVGKISYEIYLSHQILNGLIIKMGLKNNIAYALLLVISSILVSWIFYRFINNPIQKLIRMKLIS